MGRARTGWRAPGPAPAGRGVFWFASALRPRGRALSGSPAPPAPRGSRRAEPRGRAKARAGLWSSDRGGCLLHTCSRCRALGIRPAVALLPLGCRHHAHADLRGSRRDARGEWPPIGARGEAGPRRLCGTRARRRAGVRGVRSGCTLRARTGCRAGRGSGRAGPGGGVCPAPPYRSFVSRPRSGAAQPPVGVGLFPGHDVTRPCEVVTVGRGAAGGNAACGRRGRGKPARGGAPAALQGCGNAPCGRAGAAEGRQRAEAGGKEARGGAHKSPFASARGSCSRGPRGAGRSLARPGTRSARCADRCGSERGVWEPAVLVLPCMWSQSRRQPPRL